MGILQHTVGSFALLITSAARSEVKFNIMLFMGVTTKTYQDRMCGRHKNNHTAVLIICTAHARLSRFEPCTLTLNHNSTSWDVAHSFVDCNMRMYGATNTVLRWIQIQMRINFAEQIIMGI